jgi:hypothetical protein
MAFIGVDIIAVQQTTDWGIPIDKLRLETGSSYLIKITDTEIKTYTLESDDAALGDLTLTDRITKEL